MWNMLKQHPFLYCFWKVESIFELLLSKRHIVLDDCYFCKECSFPCVASYFKRIVAEEGCCPMCAAKVEIGDIKDVFYKL